MARVLTMQYNDGAPAGEETEVVLQPGKTPAEMLQVKAKSHASRGWTVRWQGKDRFIAVKEYPPPSDLAERLARGELVIRRKERLIRLAE